MTEILQELETAFKAISTIAVSGDAVDNIAVARAKLRNVYAKLKEFETAEKTDRTE